MPVRPSSATPVHIGAPRRRRVLQLAAAASVAPVGGWVRAQPSVLRVASSLDHSGVEKVNGAALHLGALACFSELNRAGGIRGAQVDLQTADDQFKADHTRDNVLRFAADPSVVAILHPQGTRQSTAVMESITELAIVGPNTGNMNLRRKLSLNTFWVRANFDQEMERLISQTAILGLERIALLHSDDALGQSMLAAYNAALARFRLQPAVISVTPSTNSLNVEGAARQVAMAVPQVIILGLAGTAPATVRALRNAGSKGTIYGLSIASAAFSSMGPEARGLGFSVVVPSPTATRFGIVRRYQAAMAAIGKGDALSPMSLEGYVNALVLAEGLRRAGPAPSRAGVIAALERIEGFDLGGMKITFGRGNREGSPFVDVATIGERGQLLT